MKYQIFIMHCGTATTVWESFSTLQDCCRYKVGTKCRMSQMWRSYDVYFTCVQFVCDSVMPSELKLTTGRSLGHAGGLSSLKSVRRHLACDNVAVWKTKYAPNLTFSACSLQFFLLPRPHPHLGGGTLLHTAIRDTSLRVSEKLLKCFVVNNNFFKVFAHVLCCSSPNCYDNFLLLPSDRLSQPSPADAVPAAQSTATVSAGRTACLHRQELFRVKNIFNHPVKIYYILFKKSTIISKKKSYTNYTFFN